MAGDWKKRPEVGLPWLAALFARSCLAVGPTVARWLLAPVCLFFLLTRRPERRASRQFLRRVLDREPTFSDLWKHFWTFSQVVLDRVFILGGGGRGIHLETEGLEAFRAELDKGRGCLMLGSHFGSFEASRAIKRERPDVSLRLLMDREQSPAATSILEELAPDLAAEVIDVGDRSGIGFALLGALANGDLVALLADRCTDDEPAVSVDFLGDRSRFPAGPHEIALVTQAPTVLFFGVHTGPGRYRVHFEIFQPPPRTGRAERTRAIEDSAQRYARRLERQVRAAPYNWFNFYDFWA